MTEERKAYLDKILEKRRRKKEKILYELYTKVQEKQALEHTMTNFWCLKPSIIDRDRRLNGDYFKKPTQYWFVNCKPKNNLIFEPLEEVPNMQIEHVTNDNPLKADRKTVRSMIHPQYADRFVRQYILDEKEWKGGG